MTPFYQMCEYEISKTIAPSINNIFKNSTDKPPQTLVVLASFISIAIEDTLHFFKIKFLCIFVMQQNTKTMIFSIPKISQSCSAVTRYLQLPWRTRYYLNRIAKRSLILPNRITKKSKVRIIFQNSKSNHFEPTFILSFPSMSFAMFHISYGNC